ncbi:MAG TPA: SDR family oxidoreductase [Anaeromyxobacter sp.]|nr:SDR family oxidoreductase [Anaeromyxobacter sp.]
MTYLDSMFSLSGKTAVVTGGAGAIPGSVAAALARAGATVCLWGRGKNHPVEVAARRIQEEAGSVRVFAVTADTGVRAACEAALAETEARCGVPAILVNGVGGAGGKGPFVDVDEERFDEVLRLNLLAGLVTPTRVLARRWIDRGVKGCVINMASMTSYKPLSGTFAYCAAKAGVLNLTQGLAQELAPHGIRVNAIAPGFFLGHQNRALLVDAQTGQPTARGRAVLARTPFGRFGELAELDGAALFLASDRAAGFITGISIPVDGGFLSDNV